MLGDDLEEVLSALRFPESHRKRIRTTNLLERLFGKGRRRSMVIPGFMTISQALQPEGDFGAVETHFTTAWSSQSFREDLGQCLPLQIRVRLRIAHRGIDIRMTEPLADGRKINPSLQQIDRSRVPAMPLAA